MQSPHPFAQDSREKEDTEEFMKIIIKNLIYMVIVIALIPVSLFAQSLNSFKIIKLSPFDEKAVIRTAGSDKMEVISVGDQIEPFGEVIQISKDGIVFKAKNDKDFEKIIISIENGKQKIIRVGGVKKKPVPVDATAMENKTVFKQNPTEQEKKYPRH